MEQPRRRLSAVWFADIVGYTELSTHDEPAAMALVNSLQAIARGAVAEYEGRIVKFIGDAVLAEFSSTESAVRAAVALQERFVNAAEASGHPAQLHIGVHLGEVTATADGDLYGDGINTAARLQHEALPGQIIISEDGWRQLRQRPEFRFESLGAVELKGISTALQIYDVVFGARAALERTRPQPVAVAAAPAAEAPAKKPMPKLLPIAVAATALIIMAAVLVPRLATKQGAAAVSADTPATHTVDTVRVVEQAAPAPTPLHTESPKPTRVESTPQPKAEPAPAVTEKPADPMAERAAMRALLEDFAHALTLENADTAVRRMYPTMPDAQVPLFRNVRESMGPDVQTRFFRFEPAFVRGDTAGITFTVMASNARRPHVPLMFEGLVVRSKQGLHFKALGRAAGRFRKN